MPIYEFYCGKCNTIYNFFSKTVNTNKIPQCPRCRKIRLKRQMSVFATISGDREESPKDNTPSFDEAKMEKAMAMLADKADKINENDPRQAADLMRRISEATGVKLGPGMEEALRRMERGDDPEEIEASMGDVLESEEPFTFEEKSGRNKGAKPKPRVDETLYDL